MNEKDLQKQHLRITSDLGDSGEVLDEKGLKPTRSDCKNRGGVIRRGINGGD